MGNLRKIKRIDDKDKGEVKIITSLFCSTVGFNHLHQKQYVFMDSHVRFFDKMGGVFKEVVYDNMKNVVAKFIGRNEKELNIFLSIN